MKRISRRRLLGTAAACALSAPAVRAQKADMGVALVIGNSKYQWEAQLPNVRRDVPDIAKEFETLGLKTELLQDAGLDATRQALARFRSAAQGARFAAFYFAGHGVASQRDNFLVPIDADLGADSIIDKVLHQSAVMEALKGASNRLAVFDACRNNPSGGSAQRATERAAAVNPEILAGRLADMPNTLMLFSTAAGRIALDGPAGDAGGHRHRKHDDAGRMHQIEECRGRPVRRVEQQRPDPALVELARDHTEPQPVEDRKGQQGSEVGGDVLHAVEVLSKCERRWSRARFPAA